MATATVRRRTPAETPPPPPEQLSGRRGKGRANGHASAAGTIETAPPAARPPNDPNSGEENSPREHVASLLVPRPMEEGEDFWTWLANIHADAWQYILIYLWRTAPTIDRRNSGRPTSIGKYAHLIDLDRVKLDHGSGGYRVDVTFRNTHTGKTARIGQNYFEIVDPEHPPKVPFGDWIDDPANEVWRAFKPGMEKAQTEAAARASGTDPNQLFDTVLKGVQILRPADSGNNSMATAIATGLTNMQAALLAMADPSKQLAMIKELIGDRGKASSEESMLVKMLLDDRKAQREELAELRKMMLESSQRQNKGLVEQIIEAAPAIEKAATLFGFRRTGAAAAAATATDWGAVAVQVVDKISDHFPLIATMWSSRNGGGPGAPGMRGFQLPPTRQTNAAAAPPEQTQQQQEAAPMAAQPEAHAEENGITDEQRQQFQAILAEFGPLIEQTAPFLIDMYRDPTMTGYDFRDWFIRRQGINNWQTLRQRVGPDNLVQLAQMHTVLRVALAPPEQLHAFLIQFFTPEGEEPEADRNEEQ